MAHHFSDCATHNAPALPVGPCDCGYDARVLLERAEGVLSNVEKDTHYELHDGDYVLPFGERRLPHMASHKDCECTLCQIRKYLSAQP